MPTRPNYIKRWMEQREAEQRIIDGSATVHEVLGEITGIPPEAFSFIEQCRATDVLAVKITQYWDSLADVDKPEHVTMQQFKAMFGTDGIGAWQIGNALRQAGWTSSRRRWKENGARCRVWVPPSAPASSHSSTMGNSTPASST